VRGLGCLGLDGLGTAQVRGEFGAGLSGVLSLPAPAQRRRRLWRALRGYGCGMLGPAPPNLGCIR